MIILDTDVLIWILRGREDFIKKFEKLVEQTNGELYLNPNPNSGNLCGCKTFGVDSDRKIFKHLWGFKFK